jgi:hypothetical protein
MTMLDQETIVWYSADAPPEDEDPVLIFSPGADEPVWVGFYDGVYWFAKGCDNEYGDGQGETPVKAWAPLPTGATCAEDAE